VTQGVEGVKKQSLAKAQRREERKVQLLCFLRALCAFA
jgi:hypothetical protein